MKQPKEIVATTTRPKVIYLEEEWSLIREGEEQSELRRDSDGATRFVINADFYPVGAKRKKKPMLKQRAKKK